MITRFADSLSIFMYTLYIKTISAINIKKSTTIAILFSANDIIAGRSIFILFFTLFEQIIFKTCPATRPIQNIIGTIYENAFLSVVSPQNVTATIAVAEAKKTNY